MPRRTVLRNARTALEENLWRMWSQFARGAGCTLHEGEDVLWFETPIPVPPYNMVVRFQRTSDVDAEVDAIFAHFHRRNVPFLWLVHPSALPANLSDFLRRRGFDEVEAITGMAADLTRLPDAATLPDGVEIHDVTPDHDLAPFAEFVASRWHVPESARMHLQSIVDMARIGMPGSPNRAWLAIKDGAALAKVFIHDGAGEVGVYGMATKPEARGLGLARTLCLHTLHDARGRGHALAVLHSTPMAVSLYRSLGFEDIAPFRLYAAPNSFYA